MNIHIVMALLEGSVVELVDAARKCKLYLAANTASSL